MGSGASLLQRFRAWTLRLSISRPDAPLLAEVRGLRKLPDTTTELPQSPDGDPRTDILVADAHGDFRTAICDVVNLHPDWHLTGMAGTGDDALELIRTRRPDIVVMDVILPDLDGITLLAELGADPAKPQVVILSHMCEAKYLLDALSLGALGYLSKADCGVRDVIGAISAAGRGHAFIAESLHEPLAEAVRSQSPT